MKSIKYILGVSFITAMVLMGCNVLDKDPLDAFSNDNFWTKESNVETYANTFYNIFMGYGNGANTNGWFYFKNFSDDQVPSADPIWDQENCIDNNALWKDSYKEIRRANVLLQHLPSVDMPTVRQEHWRGVAKMMRAYEYYILVRNFGDVQWIGDKVLDPSNSEILYGSRNKPGRDAVMDSVLADLNYAVLHIQPKKALNSWSQDLANAMKSDICLYEGTLCKYCSTPNDDRSKIFLRECVTANEALMDGTYTLTPGIDGYQATYNSVTLDEKTTKQVIFAKHYVQNIFAHSTIDYTTSTTQQHGISKSGFDAFRLLTGAKADYSTTNYPSKVIVGTANGGAEQKYVSIEDVLALRDKRLSVLVDPILAYPGNTHVRWDDNCDGVADADKNKASKITMQAQSGLTIKKYDSKELDDADRPQGGRNYTDCPLYWYAVTLLNQAEAKTELGTITDADLNATVNLLRERAGLPALTTGNYYGEESLLEAIRNERRCELMCDNWYRYWDLVRWHQLDKVLNPDCFLGANITVLPVDDRKTTNVNADGFLKSSYTPSRITAPKRAIESYYLYPIPSSELTMNKNLGQNPGW